MPGEELFYLTVGELAKRIESKKLSLEWQAYLDRSRSSARDSMPMRD
jgi:hypothetical protein